MIRRDKTRKPFEHIINDTGCFLNEKLNNIQEVLKYEPYKINLSNEIGEIVGRNDIEPVEMILNP